MLFLDPDLVRFAFERKRKAERESEQVRKGREIGASSLGELMHSFVFGFGEGSEEEQRREEEEEELSASIPSLFYPNRTSERVFCLDDCPVCLWESLWIT